MPLFATAVVRWQKKYGRHNLPWQQDNDAYKVWLSEIMLQQTQVTAVIPYYLNFLRRFPTLAVLARAHESSVLAAWSGLGYYARARNLHAAAKQMLRDGIPQDAAGWQALPGIGKSTAAAVAVFVNNERCAILDGNVKRVLARTHLCDELINTAAGEETLWQIANAQLPAKRAKQDIRAYTQGLMDLGANCCRPKQPLCAQCPLTAHCLAYQSDVVADYPKRRQAAAKKEKTAHFVLIRAQSNDNKETLLLQKQASKGIWGGLWSLPLYANGKDHWQQLVGAPLTAEGKSSFTHTFTHFRLTATVSHYRCTVSSVPLVALAPPLRWCNKSLSLALPAPIKTLLQQC